MKPVLGKMKSEAEMIICDGSGVAVERSGVREMSVGQHPGYHGSALVRDFN